MARLGMLFERAIMVSRSGQDKWAVRDISFLDISSRHLSSGDRDILEEEFVPDPLTPEVSDE